MLCVCVFPAPTVWWAERAEEDWGCGWNPLLSGGTSEAAGQSWWSSWG